MCKVDSKAYQATVQYKIGDYQLVTMIAECPEDVQSRIASALIEDYERDALPMYISAPEEIFCGPTGLLLSGYTCPIHMIGKAGARTVAQIVEA